MSPTSITKPDVLQTDKERREKAKKRFGVTSPELEEITKELTKEEKPKKIGITFPKERQEMAEKSIESSRELELESIESPTRMIRRLKPQEKSRLIPSKIQLGIIGKEIGIGIRKGAERIGEKAKKELYKTPVYLEKGTKKIGKYAIEKIRERLKEEAEFRKELADIRRREKLGALSQKIRMEERERYVPKQSRQMTAPKINMKIPLFEKRATMPIFQPRQIKMTREVARFTPNMAKLTPKLDITTLPKINKPILKRERIRL